VDIFRSSKLGRIFDHTSSTYKFYWLWGILDLLPTSSDGVLALKDIQSRMVARAYPSVARFRLSFGQQDKLQEIVRELIDKGLLPSASSDEVATAALSRPMLLSQLDDMVPTRLLTPWISKSEGLRSSKLTDEIIRQANNSQVGENPAPYSFAETKDRIVVGRRWREFFLENKVAIEDYLKLRLVTFLESRNPHSPNITQKLAQEITRDLAAAHRFWDRTLESNSGRLINLYTSLPLKRPFAVDHFIPFSFIGHDLLWNLIPTDKVSNSRKSDSLPNLDLSLPAYALAHQLGIQAHREEPKALEDHCIALNLEPQDLLSIPLPRLTLALHEILSPRLIQAKAAGF
jgi:hypothetical protein